MFTKEVTITLDYRRSHRNRVTAEVRRQDGTRTRTFTMKVDLECLNEALETNYTESDFDFDEIVMEYIKNDRNTFLDIAELRKDGIRLINHIDLMQVYFDSIDTDFPLIQFFDGPYECMFHMIDDEFFDIEDDEYLYFWETEGFEGW